MLSPEDELLLLVDDIQPVKQFIQQALSLKLKGNASHYNHIITQITSREDPEMTWRILIALANSASTLTQRYGHSIRFKCITICKYNSICYVVRTRLGICFKDYTLTTGVRNRNSLLL